MADVLLEERVPLLLLRACGLGETVDDPTHRLVGVELRAGAVEEHEATRAFVLDHGLEGAVVPVVHP